MLAGTLLAPDQPIGKATPPAALLQSASLLRQPSCPARFVGVDGPRWFLRGLIIGPAVDDPTTAAGLEAVLRDVVVARGGEPMAVRDPLPLVLPAEIADAAVTEQQEGLQMPERGPEITETR